MASIPESGPGAPHHVPGSASSTAAAVEATLNDGKHHLLLAASGSVATIKLPLIVSSFAKYPNLSIRIVLTSSAAHFLAGQSEEQPALSSLESLPNVEGIHRDEDEWAEPWTRGAKILHIALRSPRLSTGFRITCLRALFARGILRGLLTGRRRGYLSVRP